MPATLPPWLDANQGSRIYAAGMPEAFKLGAQSDQFGREMALKGAEQQAQAVRSGAEIGFQAGSQANAMAMNIANLRQQQEEVAQRMQLAWQQEADQIAQHAAALDQAAYQTELEHSIRQQQLQQEAMMNEHKLAIEREYRTGSIALEREQLNEKAAEFQTKTQQAAAKATAMAQYQQELAVAPDEESRLGVARKWFPVIGATPTSSVSLFRQVKPEFPYKVVGGGIAKLTEKGVEDVTPPSLRRASPVVLGDIADLRKKIANTENAIATGDVDEDVGKKLLEDYNAQLEAKKAEVQGTKPETEKRSAKEVTRKTKDGRLAVFDADTKEFLRYAD